MESLLLLTFRQPLLPLIKQMTQGIHPDAQFTMELQKDKPFPFLDVIVKRSTDGDLTTTVFQAATTIMRMLHLGNYHPTGYKATFP